MRTKTFLGVVALFSALAFVAPADAITINGTEYVIFGKTAVKMEDGAFTIQGSVGVNDPGGLLRVGAQNTITDKATADNMFFGSGSSVANCQFNHSTGGNPGVVCGTQGPTPPLPLTAWPPLPVPTVTPCLPNVTVLPGATLNLAPGCRQNVRVRDGGTLVLSAGVYEFKSLLLETGSLLDGNGASVNLTGTFNTEPGVSIDSVTVTSVATGTFESIEIGNNSSIVNSRFYAPFSRMHLHQGGVYSNSDFIAVYIIIEPIQTIITQQGCACVGEVVKGGAASTILLSNGCHLNATTNAFFVSTSCAVSCPGAGCFAATVQAGATDTDATLTAAGAPVGSYHVIITSPGGQFCSADVVTLP
jgi:hypothetical protein